MASSREQQLQKERDNYKAAFEALTELFAATVAEAKKESAGASIGAEIEKALRRPANTGRSTDGLPVGANKVDTAKFFTAPSIRKQVDEAQRARKARKF